MISGIARWWRRRQREIDIAILWPSLKEHAASPGRARAAFFFHCAGDSAWTKDFDPVQLETFIGRLP